MERRKQVTIQSGRSGSPAHLLAAIPQTIQAIAILDRTKEPGATGEPLYQDVLTSIGESLTRGEMPFAQVPRVIGGRYGLASKEFTPAMCKAVFDELKKPVPKNHFTVGIHDDVTKTSLDFDPGFTTEGADEVRALFWGLGADGTVGANKNTIKIIGEETDNFAQGYFVYDSKKSGAMTVSHLRFGARPIRSTYLIQRANFVAVHQFNFVERYDVLAAAGEGSTFLLNSPFSADETWDNLPRTLQQEIIRKRIRFYAINAYDVAKANGMGSRINTIMQTCFFQLTGVLPPEEAIAKIKESIKKTYGKRGEPVVRQNFAAVDAALAHLHEAAAQKKKQDSPPASSASIPQKQNPEDFVGTETCQTCHETQFNTFAKTTHAKLTHDASWKGKVVGCESCHGAGKAHVETMAEVVANGTDPKLVHDKKIIYLAGLPSKQVSETCLQCHAGREEHNNYRRGEHWRNDVGCNDCHFSHLPDPAPRRIAHAHLREHAAKTRFIRPAHAQR